MCRYTKEEDPTKLPYALIGPKLAKELCLAAKKYSVFHGLYVDKGGNFLDHHCDGARGTLQSASKEMHI